MSAKIKLNAASGGGSFSLQAPSSSANTRVMTLPDTADGTILTTTNPKAGNIIQVVSEVNKAYAAKDSAANTKYDDLGFNCQITPSSTSSKIILFYSITLSAEVVGREVTLTPTFNSGSGVTEFDLGEVDGNKTRINTSDVQPNAGVQRSFNISFHCEHSPSNTNQHTYSFRHTVQHDGAFIIRNQSFSSPNNLNSTRSVSRITAMEVAG